MHNAGFILTEYIAKTIKLLSSDGYFNFCMPLNMLFGFCKDRRVIVNARHEFILIRARNDKNYLAGDSAMESELELFKI